MTSRPFVSASGASINGDMGRWVCNTTCLPPLPRGLRRCPSINALSWWGVGTVGTSPIAFERPTVPTHPTQSHALILSEEGALT